MANLSNQAKSKLTIALRNLQTKLQGRVIITSKDSRQLDEQVWPALESHRGKLNNLALYQRYIHQLSTLNNQLVDEPSSTHPAHPKIIPVRSTSPAGMRIRRGEFDYPARSAKIALNHRLSTLNPSMSIIDVKNPCPSE